MADPVYIYDPADGGQLLYLQQLHTLISTKVIPQPDMSPCRRRPVSRLYCSENTFCFNAQSKHEVTTQAPCGMGTFRLQPKQASDTLCNDGENAKRRVIHSVSNPPQQIPSGNSLYSDSLRKFDGIQSFLLIRNQPSILRWDRKHLSGSKPSSYGRRSLIFIELQGRGKCCTLLAHLLNFPAGWWAATVATLQPIW